MSEDKIPDGKKWQKVCHDDSTPPYDSYCTFCSGSRNCYSEDKRLVNIDEPDEIHVNTIQRQKEDLEKFNEGVDACIAKLEKVKSIWVNAEFKNNPSRHFVIDHYNEIISVFEQLKKPLQ